MGKSSEVSVGQSFFIVIGAYLTIAAFLALGMCIALYYAWAFTYIWEWFVVPIFHLPKVTTLQLYGLVLMSALFNLKLIDYKDDREVKWPNTIIGWLLGPLFVLLIGYIAKSMM